MITTIREIFSIILFLIFLGGVGSIALQKTSKWIKRLAIVKVHNGPSFIWFYECLNFEEGRI